jgi:ribosomal protein S18 acetylase RimI-like enzyme
MSSEMIEIKKASLDHVDGIRRVCTDGWRETYKNIRPKIYIEKVIESFYSAERIRREVEEPKNWNGWYVALERNNVVGAGGGGMISPTSAELFVLYMDPNRKGQGIGTLLLNAITQEFKGQGASEQWVAVEKDNQMGIPFYKAKGFKVRGEARSYQTRPEDNFTVLRMSRDI